VQAGAFAVLLGSENPVPDTARQGKLWLEVSVRAARDVAPTTLSPRQLLRAAAPASPANLTTTSGACAHDHLGDTWNWGANTANGLLLTGSVPWVNGLLRATNSNNGPSIWGVNTGGGNAVRGDGYGAGAIGVYGEGDAGIGVGGNSVGNDGVVGGTGGTGMSGVYGHSDTGYGVTGRSGSTYAAVQGINSSSGYGVYGESATFRGIVGADGGANPDDSYAIFGYGDIYTTDDVTITDALADGLVSLEAGDVVVISGVGPAVVGEIPVIKVRLAAASNSAAVIGVVDQHYTLPEKVSITGQAEMKAESAVDNGVILPGEYLTVVTLGAFKVIKVDATVVPVHIGDLLVASAKPGYAMASFDPRLGSVIGKALGECKSGTCLIPLVVTLK
jgi:hypothetical protein